MAMMVNEGGEKAAKFPEKSYKKEVRGAEGFGSVGYYADTEEKIRDVQEMNVRKARDHKVKDGFYH